MARRPFSLSPWTLALIGFAGISAMGRWSPLADLVNQLWFLGPAAALISTLLLVLNWRSFPASLAGLAVHGVLCLALVWRADLPTQLSRAAPAVTVLPANAQLVRAVSFNAWGRNRAPEQSEIQIDALHADILALQEAFGAASHLRTAFLDTHPFTAACQRSATRLLSRFPVTASGCLPQQRGSLAPPGAEERLGFPAVWADLDIEGTRLTVVAVHMDWPALMRDHPLQRALLTQFLEQRGPDRMLILGDFNLAEPSFALRRMDTALMPLNRISRGRHTWPSGRFSPVPLIGIDHAWLGEHLGAVAVVAGPATGSDHRPLIVDVTLEPALPTERVP